ncbi:hypothetical protein NDR87_33010 [Nocardia sp. CDC159]|uniref:Uncharacterized protein n=1 Tax=Nocardia pulmonis TaxID=2951408 RepID=A0A9X2EDL9_9NOCA|nr:MULTISPECIES: hypothetical protein [Nocardia]MCM6778401.1 hypothetical protein [Nocardia pulmonis]MCM6791203.1 hypothetical protein [Nocardia sp. CDC159]
MTASPDDDTGGLGWLYGRNLPQVNLTFARQINARELLERMGIDQDTVGCAAE